MTLAVTSPAPSSTLLRARFRAELFVHRILLPLRIRGADLADILARMEPPAAASFAALDSAYILRRVRKALRRPIMMRNRRCFREGLLAYRFLRKAGYAPDIVFGVDAHTLQEARPSAHCWIRLDGKDVFNAPDHAMTVVLQHPPARKRPS
jgi:hypothetical protein